MSELQNYVNRLFAKYKHNQKVQELRDEVLGNLQARIDDEMANGRSYQDAFADAVNSIGSVDLLIDGYKKIAIHPLKRELAQIAVLFTTVAWILTIPCRFLRSGIIANSALMLLLIVAGIIYVVFLLSKRKDDDLELHVIDVKRMETIAKIVWVLWFVYVGISTCFTLATRFISNFWFHVPIHITGPYALAELVLSVTLPFITIFLPIYFTRVPHVIGQREVAE